MRLIISVILIVILHGCAYTPPAPLEIRTPFNPEIHAPYAQPGRGVVSGQAFLRQQGGGVVTCAGAGVFLLPATSYFRSVLYVARSGHPVQALPYEAQRLRKGSRCNAQGNFIFTDVAPGSWFVVAEVNWAVRNIGQGGVLLAEITVNNDETTDVILAEANFFGR